MACKSTLMSCAVALYILISLFGKSSQRAHGEVRIDFEPQYIPYQDIRKIFEANEDWWLYGFYFSTGGLSENNKDCTLFHKEQQTDNRITLKAIGGKGSDRIERDIIGYFYQCKDEYNTEGNKRKKPNCVRLQPPDTTFGEKLRLSYTDRKECALLRVLDVGEGTGCLVLLRNPERGLTGTCESMYKNVCGEAVALQKTYDASCTKKN
nr:uncharacterized protein LOC126537989 [Dermacentor andersoni]